MATIHRLPIPTVLSPVLVARLAETNEALRRLRGMGCRTLTVDLGGPVRTAVLVVDRNPHKTLEGFPNVHVTWGRLK